MFISDSDKIKLMGKNNKYFLKLVERLKLETLNEETGEFNSNKDIINLLKTQNNVKTNESKTKKQRRK